MACMKQIGFTLMLFVIVLSPLAAACQQGSESSTVLLKLPVLESCAPLDAAQPAVAGARVGASQASSARPLGTPMEVLIPQDTRVELRLLEGLSTATDHKGYVVHLAVVSNVVADGIVVVPAGTLTTAKLTRSGRLEFSAPEVKVSGRKIRLAKCPAKKRAEDRAEERAETGLAIEMMIIEAPLLAVELPILAGRGVVHLLCDEHRREPVDVVTAEPGEIFTFYTRDYVRVKTADLGGLVAPAIPTN